jgi:hypothetical protein
MALVKTNDEQVERFKTYVRSLNEQFARWIVQQWETKSDKFWSHGMVDYLRHAVIIKRDHPDAAALLGTSSPISLTAYITLTLDQQGICSECMLIFGQAGSHYSRPLQICNAVPGAAESNGKQERKHEAQLTILPVQHSKVLHSLIT